MIRQRLVNDHPLSGQRCPQFVGAVGDEPALAVKSPVQTAQHGVEGVGQLFEFVFGALQVDARVQRLFREAAGGVGNLMDGSQGSAGYPP